MPSFDLRPAKYSELNSGEGLVQDRFPIIKKEMLEGRADNPNNIAIFVGPTEEKFVVNKCLAMLSSLRLEKSIVQASEQNQKIKLPDILPADFQVILECAILGQNWTFTNSQETSRLIETASQFGFYAFIEAICETVFREAQTRTNVFDDEESLAIIMLHSVGFESLREKALPYIEKNAAPIFRGHKFLQLSFEDFGEILIRDNLKIVSEIDVLNAVIRWGMNVLKNENKPCTHENLRKVLVSPLNWVRFPNIKENEFRDYVIPLKILTDRQVNVMELWYKNGGSISFFNNQPRDYLQTMDSKAVSGDPKTAEEFLHATTMNNLLAQFDMSVQAHNLEVKLQNSTNQIRTRTAQVHELTNKNEELEEKVRRMERLLENSQQQMDNLEMQVHSLESSFEKWKKIIVANRFCQKLEALTHNYGNNNAADNKNNESDYNLLKSIAQKLLANEDASELVGRIEEPEGINLQLLESVNGTIEAKIVELQRVKWSESYEPLAWRLFKKETASTVVELQKFLSTKTTGGAIILRNNTSETLDNFQFKKRDDNQVCMRSPKNIQPFCTHNFVLAASSNCAGILSYDIGPTRIVVRHYFKKGHNDFGIAIAPLTLSINDDDWQGWFVFDQEDWSNDSTKVKVLCKAPTEMEKCLKLGNLFLHAELIGTGSKTVLRVLLTAL